MGEIRGTELLMRGTEDEVKTALHNRMQDRNLDGVIRQSLVTGEWMLFGTPDPRDRRFWPKRK